MKILAVDPGDVRIGLAISDESGRYARPLTTLKHISRPENAARIARQAEEHDCQLIIVGTPLDSDGNIGARARASLKLVDAIRSVSSIRVETWDESGSSQQADQLFTEMGVKRKNRAAPKDAQAAALILQDFLDAGTLENDAST
ncbi:MAG TPA: Holliday junction resolvase RuvX [Anaerolineaceae bacterium]|nr:Holliday junction resolvase RuvX [Anaerolineaceae bacterium]